jgi:metal-responsive CopG/Arc/MetJ family transcriptional regulator
MTMRIDISAKLFADLTQVAQRMGIERDDLIKRILETWLMEENRLMEENQPEAQPPQAQPGLSTEEVTNSSQSEQ